jgi:hypothetical protein
MTPPDEQPRANSRARRHPVDGAAEHALSVDCLPDGLPALAACTRSRVDLALVMVLALFTPEGLAAVRVHIAPLPPQRCTPRPGRIRRDAQARHLISGFS